MFLKSNVLYAIIVGLLVFILAACTVEAPPTGNSNDDDTPTSTPALKLISANSVSPTSIKLTFSEAVGPAASQPSNYSIDGLTVESAAITGVSVDLTTSTQADQPYIVNVSNLASAAGAALDVNASSASFQGSAAAPTATGADYNLTFNTLFLQTGGCEFVGAVDIIYTIKANGTNIARRTESNQLNMNAGDTHNINASREVSVSSSKPLELSIFVADAEPGTDTTLVNYNASLPFPLSEGAQDITQSGDGCSVRVSWTVSKVRDTFN